VRVIQRYSAGVLLLAGLVAVASARAQSPAAPAFEVASVKPNTSGDSSSRTSGRDSSFIATNTTVKMLILTAFNVKGFQLAGGPAWIESERFDVNGRPPEGVKYSRAMLRTLLEARFKLVTHTETREQPIYALVLARPDGRLGPQIKPTATLDCTPAPGANPAGPLVSPCGLNSTVGGAAGKLTAVGQPLEGLAATLGNFELGRQVIDRTGLTGKYDFELQWSSDTLRAMGTTDAAAAAPGVFTALQEQLGLRLDSQRGPVEFVIIDSIDRPTPD
jgi:uncharacterized protein (TIGR03435 family)